MQYRYAARLKPRVAADIALRTTAHIVACTVKFDRQPRWRAIESSTYGPIGCCRRNVGFPGLRRRSRLHRRASGTDSLRRSRRALSSVFVGALMTLGSVHPAPADKIYAPANAFRTKSRDTNSRPRLCSHLHPAPQSGEGGPRCAAAWWKGHRPRGKPHRCRPLHHASHGSPPPLRGNYNLD